MADGLDELRRKFTHGIPMIDLQLEGDGSGEHLKDKVMHDAGTVIHIAALDGGMGSGAPSLIIRLDLDNGEYVFAQTSVKAFLGAAAAIHAKFEDILHD